MKSFDSFQHQADYVAHVEREVRKGYLLLDTSVDEATKEAMLAQVLSPEPPDGYYVEVGPAAQPYAVAGTSRQNIRYVAIEGGKSEYYFSSSAGAGEYDQLEADTAANVAARLSAEATTRSAQFMWGDAQRLPFPGRDRATLSPETSERALPVHETFMRNVLLASGIHPRSVEKILREQARVLAENGLLIIRETNFDMLHPRRGEGLHPHYLSLLANLELTGFRRRVVLFAADSAFRELIRQYPGGDDNRAYPIGYYIICQQGEEGVITPERLTWQQRLARGLGSIASRVSKQTG